MRKLIALFCLFPLLVAQAFAQSSPGLNYGQVPTAAQWNSYFTAKQDYLGAPPCIVTGCTMTGKLTTAGSATSGAGFNLPPGAAPTSPVNGDFWSTSAGFFGRAGGVTYGPFVGGSSGTFAGTSPITVSFPAGVVTYAFDFTVANTFLAQQTDQGATTTSPGWYAQILGDTVPRVRVGLNNTDVPSIAFGPGNAARDAFIERVGPAAIRFGAPDAAAPIAQSLSVQNVIVGTTNTAGVNFTIKGSQGVGTGAGGSIVFQTAPAGSTGGFVNALATALTIDSTQSATVAGGLVVGAPTGGNKGTGTGNFAGLVYTNGNAFAASAASPIVLNATTGQITCPTCLTGTGGAITANLTATSGFTAGQFIYSDGSKVQAASFTGTLGSVVLSVAPTITGHPTIEGVTSTGATGTGNFVFSAAPTITGHPTIEGVTSTGATGTGNFVFSSTPTVSSMTCSGCALQGGTAQSLTGLSIRSTGAAFDLFLASSQAYTANRTLTLNTNDANETVFVGGPLSFNAAFATTGAGSATLAFPGVTAIYTFPTTTATLARTDAGQTFTGAEIFSNGVTFSSAITYGGVTLSNSVTGTGSMVLSAAPTITGHPTIEGVTSTGATGTGNFVFSAAPTITGHPTIEGVTSTGASGTGAFVFGTAPSISSLTVTTAFTAIGLVTNADLANASTTVNGQTCTLGGACTITASATGITINSTTITGATAGRVLYSDGTLLQSYGITGTAGSVVMSNAPSIVGGSLTALTTLAIRDTSAAFDVTLAATSSTTLTAGRTLTLDVGNVAHTLKLGTTANTITFPNLASFTVLTSGDTGTVTNTILAVGTTNTVKGTLNGTSNSDLAVGSCSTASSALIWTTNTGFGCNTAITAASVPASALTGTTLNSTVVTSSLTTVGTIGTGTWQGTAVALTYGGSGQTTALAARGSSGFNIDEATSTGDANYVILSTDRMVYHTALTAARTDTLPAANAVNAGQILYLVDFAGVASASNTVTVQRAGSDTVNGGTSFTALNSAYGEANCWSDGTSKWTCSTGAGGGGGGGGTVTSVAIATAGGATTTGTCTITSSGTCVIYSPGGYLNKFRNGTMDVWQRGIAALSINSTGTYGGADGWIIGFTGSASVTTVQAAGNGGPLYALEVEGAASNTDITISQRIESYVAAPLAGQTVTVQFKYYQSSGGTVTPKFSTCYASATDNFGTCTSDIGSTSLSTACATATWCTESYTFTASANATNGYQVTFDCNAGFTLISVSCRITAADIRVTPGVSTGVNANPPPPELRPLANEMIFCQRYYTTTYGNGVAPGASTTNGMVVVGLNAGAAATNLYLNTVLPVQMRATPTLAYYDSAGTISKASYTTNSGTPTFTAGNTLSGASFYTSSSTGFFFNWGSASGSAGDLWWIHYTASAEL